MRVRADG